MYSRTGECLLSRIGGYAQFIGVKCRQHTIDHRAILEIHGIYHAGCRVAGRPSWDQRAWRFAKWVETLCADVIGIPE